MSGIQIASLVLVIAGAVIYSVVGVLMLRRRRALLNAGLPVPEQYRLVLIGWVLVAAGAVLTIVSSLT